MGMFSPDENGWILLEEHDAELQPLRGLEATVRALLANESAPPGGRDRERNRLLEVAFRALEPIDKHDRKRREGNAPRVDWVPAPGPTTLDWPGDTDGATFVFEGTPAELIADALGRMADTAETAWDASLASIRRSRADVERAEQERQAEIARQHFVDGVSWTELADRHFTTIARIEQICRPVRVLLDSESMRAVLAIARDKANGRS